MLFRRAALLDFYDHPNSWKSDTDGRGSHVSAVTGIIGEDLILGLLLHYWQNTGLTPTIISYACNTGKVKGKRLDAWILQGKDSLFQVEVKSWSGHSLGGYNLPTSATTAELSLFGKKRWTRYFGPDASLPDSVAKVLLTMKPPDGYESLVPRKLVCFWEYIVDSTARPYWSHHIVGETLEVFSASAYLRTLKVETIELPVLRIDARLRLLNSLRSEEEGTVKAQVGCTD